MPFWSRCGHLSGKTGGHHLEVERPPSALVTSSTSRHLVFDMNAGGMKQVALEVNFMHR